jgi:hypothetical protein
MSLDNVVGLQDLRRRRGNNTSAEDEKRYTCSVRMVRSPIPT